MRCKRENFDNDKCFHRFVVLIRHKSHNKISEMSKCVAVTDTNGNESSCFAETEPGIERCDKQSDKSRYVNRLVHRHTEYLLNFAPIKVVLQNLQVQK